MAPAGTSPAPSSVERHETRQPPVVPPVAGVLAQPLHELREALAVGVEVVLERLLQHPVHDLQVLGDRHAVLVRATRRTVTPSRSGGSISVGVDRAGHVQPSATARVAGRLEPAALRVVLGERRRVHPGALQPAQAGDRPALVLGPGVERRGDRVRRRDVALEPERDRRSGRRRGPAPRASRAAGRRRAVTTSWRRVHDAVPTTSDSTAASSTAGSPVYGARSATRRRDQGRDVVLLGQRGRPQPVGGDGRGPGRPCAGHRDRWRARAKQNRP